MRLTYPPEYKGIVNSIRRKATRLGIKIVVDPGDMVTSGPDDIHGSAGYLDEANKQLVVSTGHSVKSWMQCLIHESCHMDQLSDLRLEEWNRNIFNFYEWLEERMTFNKAQLEYIRKSVVDCELDCEQRSVEKIIKWGLPISVEQYIRKANAYLYGHHVIVKTRKFYNELTYDDSVWKLAPATFQDDYDQIPRKLYKAFMEHIEREEAKQEAA